MNLIDIKLYLSNNYLINHNNYWSRWLISYPTFIGLRSLFRNFTFFHASTIRHGAVKTSHKFSITVSAIVKEKSNSILEASIYISFFWTKPAKEVAKSAMPLYIHCSTSLARRFCRDNFLNNFWSVLIYIACAGH